MKSAKFLPLDLQTLVEVRFDLFTVTMSASAVPLGALTIYGHATLCGHRLNIPPRIRWPPRTSGHAIYGTSRYTRALQRVVRLVHLGELRTVQEEEWKQMMKPSTNDQIQGALHEVKGALKEKVGQITNNPDLKTEGQIENLAGKVQKKVGQIEKVLEK